MGQVPYKNQATDLKKPTGAQSIQRAVGVLRTVAKYNEAGATLSKIARHIGLHVATAHRILNVLTAEGLITHDPASKLYRLGIELMHLGSQVTEAAFRDQLRPSLKNIAARTGDTVFLIMRQGFDVLCIDRLEGEFPIRAQTFDIGSGSPMGIGAGSLAMMSALPDLTVQEIIHANQDRYPLYKNQTADHVLAMIRLTQEQGYAISQGVFTPGATSVALPVFSQHGEPFAAVSVSAINERLMPQRRQEVAEIIKAELAGYEGRLTGDRKQ